jgi:hypothetical protein
VPSQLERLKPEEVHRNEEKKPKRPRRRQYKSGYNPGPRSFIDIMQYHQGLLHQRGHGWGALAKIAAKVAAPIVAQVLGGLLGGAPQPGQEIQNGHGSLDSLLNTAIVVSHMFGDKKAPSSYFKNGKLVSNTKAQSGRGVKCVKRQQKGKGFITDLLKTGAKQALRAAAQTGSDVLDNKRSLKEAIKTHGIRAIKSTAQPLLA